MAWSPFDARAPTVLGRSLLIASRGLKGTLKTYPHDS
jgi:hypothetical protein